MKKTIAIILALMCILSSVAVMGLAATDNIIGDIVEDYIGVTEEPGIEDEMMYGIHYEMTTLTVVSPMYMPAPTITFKQPVTTQISFDTPIAIDYEFICWKHSETGELYYPGDTIDVTGKVVLYAVWEEKTDGYPRFIRAIISGFETLNRLLKKFLGVYDTFVEFDESYYATTTTIAA